MSNAPKVKITVKVRPRKPVVPKYKKGDMLVFTGRYDYDTVIRITDIDLADETYEFQVLEDPDPKMVGMFDFYNIDILHEQTVPYKIMKFHNIWREINL